MWTGLCAGRSHAGTGAGEPEVPRQGGRAARWVRAADREPLRGRLAEYTARDQNTKPLGRDIDDALAKVRDLHDTIGNVILAGYDWRSRRAQKSRRAFINAVLGTVDYLRDPQQPGNQPAEGEHTLAERFRKESGPARRFYALCSSSGDLHGYRDDIAFFEAVRVWMAKYDAEDRRTRGLSVPADVELYLRQLTAGAVEAGGSSPTSTRAAGIPRPDLSHLDEPSSRKCSKLATLIWRSKRCVVWSNRRCGRPPGNNVVAPAELRDRLLALMTRYTNQNLTAAQVIAELVAMAREVSADADRGKSF